jgi:hypothetical protein
VIEPGRSTTRQITDAVFGGLSEEKLLTQRQLTRRYELDNQIVEACVLNGAELEKTLGELADALKQAVMNSALDREAKENFLFNLATWPLRLKTVARAQTKLARRNGQAADEGESES